MTRLLFFNPNDQITFVKPWAILLLYEEQQINSDFASQFTCVDTQHITFLLFHVLRII